MALNSPARRQFIFFLLSDFPQQFPLMLNIMFKRPLNSNVQNSCVQLVPSSAAAQNSLQLGDR